MIPWQCLIIAFSIGACIAWAIAAKYWYEVNKKRLKQLEKHIEKYAVDALKDLGEFYQESIKKNFIPKIDVNYIKACVPHEFKKSN